MEPYLKHPMRRIREWAKNEIEEAKRWIEWGDIDDIDEAEFERG